MQREGSSQEETSSVRVVGGVTDVPGTVHALRTDADGILQVNDIGGGGPGGGGIAQADKSAFVEGTTEFTPVGGVFNETISSDPAEDEAAAARITAKRAVHTNLRNNSGTEIGTGTDPVRIDPTGTTIQPVSGTVTATVSGTVTANAGTNLNTSLLALESGGNLAASATSLAIIDDWDESDRAKTNPIVGQAGVQGGSGTVSANTQRMVLATNVALPTGSNTIGSISSITSSVVPGTTSTELGKEHVGLFTSGGTGVQMLGHDTLNDRYEVPSVADYAGFGYPQMAVTLTGETVSISGAIDVNSVVPGTAASSLGKAEDALHTSGDVGVFSLSVRTDGAGPLSGNGDYAPFQTDSIGLLKVGLKGVNGLPHPTSNVLGLFDVPATSIADPGSLGLAEVAATAPTGATSGLAVRNIPGGRRNLTAASPTSASVGVASGVLVASNASRKGLILTNLSTARVSLNMVGGAAVLDTGVTLQPGYVFHMDEYDFTTAEIRAIASAAASTVAIQEFS